MPRVADEAYFNHRPGHSEAWRAHAVCSPVIDHYWWARGKGSRLARSVGKRICNEICPVQQECLKYAQSAMINHGIWGGLDEEERRALRRHPDERLAVHHVTVYAQPTPRKQEMVMVTVIAKVRFAPHLAVGDTGDVEDDVARAAIRNGYAELVGQVENFDEWMYERAPLKLASKPRTVAKEKPARRGTRKAVAATVTDGGE